MKKFNCQICLNEFNGRNNPLSLCPSCYKNVLELIDEIGEGVLSQNFLDRNKYELQIMAKK